MVYSVEVGFWKVGVREQRRLSIDLLCALTNTQVLQLIRALVFCLTRAKVFSLRGEFFCYFRLCALE